MPLIPAFQRQAYLLIQDQPGPQSELQDSQDYTEKNQKSSDSDVAMRLLGGWRLCKPDNPWEGRASYQKFP